MRTDDKKYHNYSLSFYMKQLALTEVSNRVKMGFHNFNRHEKSVKSRTIQLFLKFAGQNKSGQRQLLDKDSQSYIDALLDVIRNLDADRDLMEFVLPTLDAIITQQKKVLREIIELLKLDKGSSLLTKLKSFLNVDDHKEATYEAVARIVSTIYGELPKQTYFNEQKAFLLELIQMRKQGRKKRIQSFCLMSCLIHLNKHEDFAQIFLENNGSALITSVLQLKSNEVQLIYYCFLNIWLLSFTKQGVEKFLAIGKTHVIKQICQVLQKISREKLIRVAFSIFKNIQHNNQCLQLMMDSKLIKIIDTLLKGNIKQNQLIEDIKNIGEVLQSNIRILSSFDKYCRQINTQTLQWSSVHTERFWRENYLKFEANEYSIIKKLRVLLTNKNPLIQSIACYDLGEFCRFNPNGRMVLQTLNIKQIIMDKARYSSEKTVREQALLALQKIMIQNWQNI